MPAPNMALLSTVLAVASCSKQAWAAAAVPEVRSGDTRWAAGHPGQSTQGTGFEPKMKGKGSSMLGTSEVEAGTGTGTGGNTEQGSPGLCCIVSVGYVMCNFA